MKLFTKICYIITAINFYKEGVSVKDIAKQAHKSQSTIRRWLKIGKAIPSY